MNAIPINFATGPVTPTGGTLPVNVTATFNVDSAANTITLALLNLQDNPFNSTQEISRIDFTLSNLGGTLSATLTANSQTFIDINGGGTPTISNAALGWGVGTTTANILTFCTVCPNGVSGGGQKQLIIGGPDGATGAAEDYTNADNTITKNKYNTHILASGASYAAGPLTAANTAPSWVLSVPAGVLAPTTTITSVTFYFGNNGTIYEVDNNGFAREPGTWALMISGLLLGAAASRKLKQTRPQR